MRRFHHISFNKTSITQLEALQHTRGGLYGDKCWDPGSLWEPAYNPFTETAQVIPKNWVHFWTQREVLFIMKPLKRSSTLT